MCNVLQSPESLQTRAAMSASPVMRTCLAKAQPRDRNVNGDSMSSTGIIARCNSLKTLKYMDLAHLGPCIFKFFKRTKPRHALDSRSAQDGPQTPKPPTKITKYRSHQESDRRRVFYNVLQLSPRKYSSVSSVSTRHCCLGGECGEAQGRCKDLPNSLRCSGQ